MLTIDNIFTEFDDGDIVEAAVTTENVYGWLRPDDRQQKDELSEISLRPYRPRFNPGDPVPQLQPGPIPRYFYKVYDRTSGIQLYDEAKYPQFTVTYGNANGDGVPPSSDIQPTRAIYEQYANSVLPSGVDSWGFKRDHFYAINLNRRVFRKRLRPGHWELSLAYEGTGSANGVQLVDRSVADSSVKDNEEIEVVPGDVDGQTAGTDVYGYVYPGKGILILDPDRLSQNAEATSTGLSEAIAPETRDPSTILSEPTPRTTTEIAADVWGWQGGFGGSTQDAENEFPDWPWVRNHKKIFDAVQRGESFRVQAKADVVESTYSIFLDQDEYNYTFNPTFSDSSGNVTFPEGSGTFPTTVGLYNDDYELLATAKLSAPRRKTDRDAVSFDVTITF